MTRPPANPIAVWVGILVLYVVWGSTYLGHEGRHGHHAGVRDGRVPVRAGGPDPVAPRHRLEPRPDRPAHAGRRSATRRSSARCCSSAGPGLVAWGEQTIPTGIAALLIALVPMWLAIFGFALYRESVPPLVGAGIVVGLIGVAILAWPAGDVGSLDPAGLLALMVSPVFWTLGTLYATKRSVQPAPALLASGVQMLAAGRGVRR